MHLGRAHAKSRRSRVNQFHNERAGFAGTQAEADQRSQEVQEL